MADGKHGLTATVGGGWSSCTGAPLLAHQLGLETHRTRHITHGTHNTCTQKNTSHHTETQNTLENRTLVLDSTSGSPCLSTHRTRHLMNRTQAADHNRTLHNTYNTHSQIENTCVGGPPGPATRRTPHTHRNTCCIEHNTLHTAHR